MKTRMTWLMGMSLAALAFAAGCTPPTAAASSTPTAKPPTVVFEGRCGRRVAVTFGLVGQGNVEYAALVHCGIVSQVASVTPIGAQAGDVVVLTVRAAAGQRASCRIGVIGEATKVEISTADGHTATCIWWVA